MKSTRELRNYSCNDFCSQELPLIEIFSLEKESNISKVAKMNEIIFTTKGNSKIETDFYPDYKIDKKQAIFLPTGCTYRLTSTDESTFVIIRIEPFQNIDGSFFTTNSFQEFNSQTRDEIYGIIRIKPILEIYLDHLVTYVQDGFNASGFYEIKITELILILSRYYTTQELICFFNICLIRTTIVPSLH